MSRSANRNQPARTYNDDIHQTDDYGEEEVTTGRRKAYGTGNGGNSNGHTARATPTSDVPQLSRAGPPNGRGGGRGATRRGRPQAPDTYSTPATTSSSNSNGNARVISETIEKRVPAPHDLTGLILSGLMANGVGKTASFSADEKAFIVTGTRQEVARTEKLINQLRNQYVEKRGHELQAKIDAGNGNGARANGRESKNNKGKAAAAATTSEAPAKKEKKEKKNKKEKAGEREEKKRTAPATAAALPAKKEKKEKKGKKEKTAAIETKAATASPSASVEAEPIGAGVTIATDECKRKLEISADIIKYISARVRQIISKSKAKVTEERPFITLEGTRVQVDKAEKQIRKFADEGARKKANKDAAGESKTPAAAAAPKKEKAEKKEKKEKKETKEKKTTAAAAPSKKVAESKTSANGTKAVVAEVAAKKEKKEKKKAEHKEKKAAAVANGESKTPAATATTAKKAATKPAATANVSEQPKEPKTSQVFVEDEIFQGVVGDGYSELQAISDRLHVTMNVTQSEAENKRVIILRGDPSQVNKAKGLLIGRIKYLRSTARRAKRAATAAAAATAASATTVTADATAPSTVGGADAA